VGEATKLGPWLTADDKAYVARIAFGRATDTLDTEGTTTATAEVPASLRDELRACARVPGSPGPALTAALAAEVARTEQVPPAYSAIQVDGKRSYDRARAGEEVVLAARPVTVRALRVLAAGATEPGAEPWVELSVEVSKGYYVRSLARDVGEHLGVPAHLIALRRTASGQFALDRAVRLDAGPEALRAALVPLAAAAVEALPAAQLTAAGAERARQGKRLGEADFTARPPDDGASAWLDPGGLLVAVGARLAPEPDGAATDSATRVFVVQRGFVA